MIVVYWHRFLQTGCGGEKECQLFGFNFLFLCFLFHFFQFSSFLTFVYFPLSLSLTFLLSPLSFCFSSRISFPLLLFHIFVLIFCISSFHLFLSPHVSPVSFHPHLICFLSLFHFFTLFCHPFL